MQNDLKQFIVSVVLVFVVIIVLVGAFFAWPMYRVWQREMAGKAELREAEWNRQVTVEEARANLEAEKMNALAEVERAKGAAEAIAIEGGSLSERYIQYLWVRQNKFNEATTIYIPTEANLPLLEAGRAVSKKQ